MKHFLYTIIGLSVIIGIIFANFYLCDNYFKVWACGIISLLSLEIILYIAFIIDTFIKFRKIK